MGLIAGIFWTKSQSPLFPGGGGTVVTDDWFIMHQSFVTMARSRTGPGNSGDLFFLDANVTGI